MILVVGVHGVGKTTLIEEIKTDSITAFFSISDLIRSTGKEIDPREKCISNINDNQLLWKEKLKSYQFTDEDIIILDGHFNLIDDNEEIVTLDFNTFEDIGIDKVILKREKSEIIHQRLKERDGNTWDINVILKLQELEEKQSTEFCNINQIPMFIYQSRNQFLDLKKFIYYDLSN